jgi:biotin operon repressor
VAGLLARGPRSVAEVATALDLSEQRVRRHLNRLVAAGIAEVEPDRRSYRLATEALRQAAREAGPARDPGLALGAVFDEEERVLRQYFRAGRLTEIPAKRSKRLIVLERLALEFDVGLRYAEREVNETLNRFHDDYASLRRYLIDEALLSRNGGDYWRSGGRVELG